DPVEESAASGYDFDRLAALTRIVGLPPGPGELLQLLNRGHIDEVDYFRGISEGNTRNEWAPFLLHLREFILSPRDAAGLRLRGWIDKPTAEAIGALHGASPETMERLYLNRGRPAAPGQMATMAVRGIAGPLGRPMDEEQFLIGIRESDIRPEW